MRAATLVLLCLTATAAGAADKASGRWQGAVQVPGHSLHATVDIDRDTHGAWSGSLIVPELAIANVPLADIAEHDGNLAFAINGALARPNDKPARFSGRVDGDVFAGTFTQAGNSAPFELHRSGSAQVVLPQPNASLPAAFAGIWTGEYELLGYARQVTVTFTPHAEAPGTATWVIVGKRHNDLPVDVIQQHGDFVRIESHAIGINFEGRLNRDAGEIRGTYEQGPIELPLVLKHTGSTP
jgi:hypothetical protein